MAKKCPKCGAQFSGLVNGHQIYWCGSEQVDKAFTQTVKCFETQLATVEAERDSLKAKLAIAEKRIVEFEVAIEEIRGVRPAIIPLVPHDATGHACQMAMDVLDNILDSINSTVSPLAAVTKERDLLKAKLARIKEVRPAIIPCVTHDDAGAACCAAMGILDRVLSDTPKEVGDD